MSKTADSSDTSQTATSTTLPTSETEDTEPSGKNKNNFPAEVDKGNAKPTFVSPLSAGIQCSEIEGGLGGFNQGVREIQELFDAQSAYRYEGDPNIRIGTRMLRGGIRNYSPCVLDRPGWENFYLSLPYDYDLKNDPVFNCHKSTYKRLMGVGAPVPESTTSEMLRTGNCGPDPDSYTRPAFLRTRENDKRPEPAYRLHLSDRTSLHYMRSDPLEGVLPMGRTEDNMSTAKSVTKRDYKWRICCPVKVNPPPVHTIDRTVHRIPKTDLNQPIVDRVVKFDDEGSAETLDTKLVKLKKAYHWPKNPITGTAFAGHLLYSHGDPCFQTRREIWPTGEKDVLDPNPICIPEDRCEVMANRPKDRTAGDGLGLGPIKPTHFHNKSYLDMRYPIRNYECWEEVPRCCGPKFQDFPSECCFRRVEVNDDLGKGNWGKKSCKQ